MTTTAPIPGSRSTPLAAPVIPELPADLTAGLRRLKLAKIRAIAAEVMSTAKTQRWTPEELLRNLIEPELVARDESSTVNRL